MEHKSERMMQECLANGWKAQVKPEIPESGNPDEFVWKLYALREKETLQCTWLGNRMQGATYTYGEHYRRFLNWRNEVMKFVTGKPNPRKLRVNTPENIEEAHWVPWEKDAPAFEIMQAVLRKEITWWNSFSGETTTAFVNVDIREKGSARHFRVYQAKSGRRLVEWADNLGFHAVALDSIINVA